MLHIKFHALNILDYHDNRHMTSLFSEKKKKMESIQAWEGESKPG